MFRQFISIILLVSLVALSSSGILMIVLGSFEFQLQMHPVHKIFGILLTLSGAFHLYYNFSAIKKYLSKRKMMLFAMVMTFLMISCPVSQRYTSFQKVISLNILGKILNISGLILNQLSTASNGVLTFNSFLKLPCLLLKL